MCGRTDGFRPVVIFDREVEIGDLIQVALSGRRKFSLEGSPVSSASAKNWLNASAYGTGRSRPTRCRARQIPSQLSSRWSMTASGKRPTALVFYRESILVRATTIRLISTRQRYPRSAMLSACAHLPPGPSGSASTAPSRVFTEQVPMNYPSRWYSWCQGGELNSRPKAYESYNI